MPHDRSRTGPSRETQLRDVHAGADDGLEPASTGPTDGVERPAPGTGSGRSGRGMGGVAVYTALSALSLPLTSLLAGPILARALGPEDRGRVLAVMAPVFVLSFVANMGLPEATTYGIARLRLRATTVLAAVSRLSLVYGAVAAGLLYLVAPHLLNSQTRSVLPLLHSVALVLPLIMVVVVLRYAVNGMRRFRNASTERVLSSLLRLGFFALLAGFGMLDLRTAVVAQVLATLLGGLYLLSVVLRSAPPQDRLEAAPPRELTRTLAGYGLRGWGGVFGNLVNWRLDQLVLVALVAPVQLGYYAVAVHFAELPSTMMNQLRNVLFAESAHRGDLRLVARFVRTAFALVLGSVLVGVLLAPVVVRTLFGTPFLPAVPMAQVLLLGSVPFCVEQLLAAGLLASGKPGRRSAGQVTAAVITVVGLVVLAPRVGAIGAAWTSLTAYTLNCTIALVMFRRVSGLPLREILLPRPSDLVWLTRRLRAVRGRKGRKGGPGTPGPTPVSAGRRAG